MMMTMAPVRLSLSRLRSVWSYQSFAVCRRLSDKASIGFSGSSIMMMSAPRPVRTPPTEGSQQTFAGRAGNVAPQQFETAGNNRKQVVEVVGDAARKLPDRFDAL